MNDFLLGILFGIALVFLTLLLVRDIVIKHFIEHYIKIHAFRQSEDNKEDLVDVISQMLTYLYPVVVNLLDNRDKYSLTDEDLQVLTSFKTLVDLEQSNNS